VTEDDIGVFRDNCRMIDGNVGVLEITAKLERVVLATLKIIAE
jgi:hypothetical protein